MADEPVRPCEPFRRPVHEGERRRLVDGVDLAVEAGEIYGIVGESGSGKSLSMMASVGLAARGVEVIEGTVDH